MSLINTDLNNKGYTNYTIIGDPTYNDGVYSDFRHDRYLQFPQDLKGTDKTYIVKFTTASIAELLQGRQFIVNTYKFFTLCLYEGYVCLLDWANNAEFNHLFAPATNTTYYVKAAYNGLTVTVSHSMDGTSWVQDLQYTYSELVTSKDQYGFSVGSHPVWSTSPFRGSIDLNDFYVLDTATQKVLWMPSTKPASLVTNYSVTGSPTISSDFVVSNFSSSSYVTTTTPAISESFDMIARFVLPATASKNGSYPDSFSVSGSDNVVFGLNITGTSFKPVLNIASGATTTATTYAGTTVWTWLKMTTTTCELYLLEDSTNQYTLNNLPSIGSWTRKGYYNDSTNRLSYVSGKTLYFGVNIHDSKSSANWTIDLKNSKYVSDSVEHRIVEYVKDTPDYGSISISDGYYNNGVKTIQMPYQTIQAGSLKNGQIPGNRTKAYAVSSSGVASVKLVGNDATEQALKGTYDVYAALDQPVYLSHAENYLTSGDAGDISQAEFSYASGEVSANFTVVGSPTVNENFVVSGFSPSNYVTTTTPTVTSTFDMIARHVLPASASKNGDYPKSLSFSGADVGFGLNVSGSSFTPALYFASSSTTTTTNYANTTVWTWLKMTTTTCELYVLEDSTNQYTLDTLPAIGSWTRKGYYSGSTNRLSYVSGKTLYFGVSNYNSNASANWTIDLKNSKYVADGVEWRGVTTSPASVTIPKTFWYDSTGHSSYWYPQSVTVALADAKAEQTVGDVNRIFVTNELGQDLSGITLAEEEVVGDYTTSALVPFYNAYLDHDTNSYILGLQKDPDEVIIVGSGSGATENYTVVGSPTISSDYVASGFSSRNCVAATETLDTSTSWSIFTKVTTSSNVSTRQKFVGCASSADQKVPTLEFRNSAVWVCIPNAGGNGWLAETSTGFNPSANTTYWFELSWSGSVYSVKVSTDGTNYTQIYSNTSSEAAYHSDSYKVCFGNDLYSSNEQLPFLGSVDLKECYFKDSSATTWRAVEMPSPTQVSIGTSDNWTALQNRTYWYEEGNTTDVADLTSDTYEADLKGYLIFSEDANEDLIVKGYTSAYTVTTYNTPDVYSGYSYTVTDSTGTAIDTLEKTGTLCKAYTIPAMAGLKFVFIPAEDLEDGHVYEAGDIREAYSETNGTPFRQLDESTEDYTYNASTDTLTDENDGELTCIGHVYVEWNDIAE